MRTVLIITGIILTTPLISFSQEYEYVAFPDSGVIWSEIYYPPIFSGIDPNYERFALSGEDTIINSLTYKKLYIYFDTIFNKNNATYIGGIREDSQKRVYYKGDTVIHDFKPMIDFHDFEEIVLFDFSVNIGDTIREGNFPEGAWIIVENIDTIQIGNTYRKRFHFNPMPWVKWIEGIGSLKGLLFTSGDLPTNGLNNDLICFKQNGEILYFNTEFSDCIPFITSIKIEKHDNSEITLFPNPSNINSIKINFGELRISIIQIVDCNGRLIGIYNVEMHSSYNLSTEKYQPGIYFYKATNENGIAYTGKFVVQF